MSGVEARAVSPGNGAVPRSEPLRLRADLQIHRRERLGRRQYWLANPISGRVVRLAGPDFDSLTGAALHPTAADPALPIPSRAT